MSEYTTVWTKTWRAALSKALRRAGRAMLPRPPAARRRGWSYVAPAVLILAGVLFATSANTSRGTDLRTDRRELTELIRQRKTQVESDDARASRLRAEVQSATSGLAGSDIRIAEQQRRANGLQLPAGMVALRGPGVTIELTDAPRRPDGSRPNARPDDLVVHQQDVQAVVNALWMGGAEAMSIMDVRVISTSAVRCVGNTLLLHGRVYSPPFVIKAIGESKRMLDALDASPGVQLYRRAAKDFGLGYEVTVEGEVKVPAYTGSTGVEQSRVAGRSGS